MCIYLGHTVILIPNMKFLCLTLLHLRTHNLVAHKLKHMKFKWFREVKTIWILTNAHKFHKKGHSDIIPFVYEGKEEICKYMQYEVSMADCMGRIANQRKVSKYHLKIGPYGTKLIWHLST